MICRNCLFFIFTSFCINVIASKCTFHSYGLYCTNIGLNNTQSIILDYKNEENLNISTIFLRNTTGLITNATFLLYPNLHHLDIQFCTISKFTANFTTLHVLYLIKNYGFPNLTSQFFEKCCQNLTMLIIDDNNFNISEGVFKYTKNLNHLTINNQNIKHLKNNHLKGLNELTYLDLKYNNLEIIDGNAFIDLKNLNHLILSYNNITSFDENTFKNLINLQSLELLNLNLITINKTVFKNQRQLRYIGIPTKLVKETLSLKNLTDIFSNLESIGLLTQDQDTKVKNFIKTCNYSGFNVILI